MAKITASHTFYLTSYKRVSGGTAYSGTYGPNVVLGKSSEASGARSQFGVKESTTIVYAMALDKNIFPTGTVITDCTFSAGVYCSLANQSYTTTKEWTFELGGQTATGTIGRNYTNATTSDSINVANISVDDFVNEINFTINWANTMNSGSLYIYGAQLVVTYEYETSGDMLYLKNSSGVWVPVTKIFKKENGSWVEKPATIFNTENISQLIIG